MKSLKIALGFCLAAAAGCFLGVRLMDRLLEEERSRFHTEQTAWQAEKAELEAAIQRASRASSESAPIILSRTQTLAAAAQLTPAQIIARLQELRGPSQVREAVYWLEELARCGPAALADIRAYLERNQDVEMETDWAQSKAAREGRLPGDFILPPSLRLGLLDVARRIGGADAEKLLADTLGSTGRGLEVAYITRLLQELSPNNYKDLALSVAQRLLSAGPIASQSALDKNHRDFLFAVLAFYGDATYVASAQTQIISPDGKVDPSALRYMQQYLGAQMVPIAAQAYTDSRVSESAAKESLARVALAFVGTDQRANDFWQQSINDMSLDKHDRKQLIEDLNQDGFADRKHLTQNDLPLVENRLALIEQLGPSAQDPVNIKAFQEAYKDLTKMRERIINPPPPDPAKPPKAK